MKYCSIVIAIVLLFLAVVNNNEAAEPFDVTLEEIEYGGDIREMITFVPFEDGVLVGEKFGVIYKLTPTTTDPDEIIWEKELFLDLSTQILNSGKQGFYSIAVSPFYTTTGNIYLSYINLGGDSAVSRYHVPTATLTTPLLIEQNDTPEHKGGQLLFGLDNMLYLALGDGMVLPITDPNNPAQNPGSLLGKILRVNVEIGNPVTYTVPLDNPYVNNSAYQPEIWAMGFRNPWKATFDSATGAMYISDVGKSRREEINYIPAGRSGLNFGWNCYEGTLPYNLEQPLCEGINPTAPISELTHEVDNACAVIGGAVYRGPEVALTGIYIFSDLCTQRLYGLRQNQGLWERFDLIDNLNMSTWAFGEDRYGHLYFTDRGHIYRLRSNALPAHRHANP